MKIKFSITALFISFIASSQVLKKEDLVFFVQGEALGFSKEKGRDNSYTGFFLTDMKDTSVISYFDDYYDINDSLKVVKKNRCKSTEYPFFCKQAIVNINTRGYQMPLDFSEIKGFVHDSTILYNTVDGGLILNFEFDTLSTYKNKFINHSPLGYYLSGGKSMSDSHYSTYDKNGRTINNLQPFYIDAVIDSNAILLIDFESYERAKIVDYEMKTKYEVDVFEIFSLKDTPDVYVPSMVVYHDYPTVLLRNKKYKWYDPVRKFSKKHEIEKVYQLKAGFDDALFVKGEPLLFVKTYQNEGSENHDSFILDVKGKPITNLNEEFDFVEVEIHEDYFFGIKFTGEKVKINYDGIVIK